MVFLPNDRIHTHAYQRIISNLPSRRKYKSASDGMAAPRPCFAAPSNACPMADHTRRRDKDVKKSLRWSPYHKENTSVQLSNGRCLHPIQPEVLAEQTPGKHLAARLAASFTPHHANTWREALKITIISRQGAEQHRHSHLLKRSTPGGTSALSNSSWTVS